MEKERNKETETFSNAHRQGLLGKSTFLAVQIWSPKDGVTQGLA